MTRLSLIDVVAAVISIAAPALGGIVASAPPKVAAPAVKKERKLACRETVKTVRLVVVAECRPPIPKSPPVM